MTNSELLFPVLLFGGIGFVVLLISVVVLRDDLKFQKELNRDDSMARERWFRAYLNLEQAVENAGFDVDKCPLKLVPRKKTNRKGSK